jgi:hypothetical protein
MNRLSDLATEGCRVSTGLLVSWEDRLCFALSQSHYWEKTEDGKTIIHCIGIGGGLEGSEDFIQAVSREAKEEAQSEIRLLEPPLGRTLYWGPDQQLTWLNDSWSDSSVSPLFLWQKEWIIRKPNQEPYYRRWFTPVYLAEFMEKPQPSMENLAIIQVPRSLFPNLLKPMLLAEAKQAGLLICGHHLPAEEEIMIGLSGSAFYTAQVWDTLFPKEN